MAMVPTMSSDNVHEERNEIPAKCARIEQREDKPAKNEISSLKDFALVKLLWNDVSSKTVYVQGEFQGENQKGKNALIKLEKSPFDDESIKKYLSDSTKLQLTFQNDIYSQYNAVADPALNTIKAVTILPATEKHILKYSEQDFFMVNETPKDYSEIVLPYIIENQHSLQWVYNILEHKAEVNRIICKDLHPDNGFVLLPDLKWNEKQMADLHVTAIVIKKEILSLRDLHRGHLPLLKNVLQKGKKAIKEKYGIKPDELRVFVHYHPSYYHLHVHFMSTKNISASCAIGKAHFVDEIIDNIENIDAEFYKKRTLVVGIGSQSELFTRFIEAGKIILDSSS